MALTVVDIVSAVDLPDDFSIRVADVTFDSSYPTGGESLTAEDLQLSRVDFVGASMRGVPADTNAVVVGYDYTNSLLTAYRVDQVDDFLEQVPNTTNLSTVTVRVFAVGAPE